LGFSGKNIFLGGKIFVFILFLIKSFLGTTNFGRHKKIGGALSPNAPRGYGPAGKQTCQRFSLRIQHFGFFMFHLFSSN